MMFAKGISSIVGKVIVKRFLRVVDICNFIANIEGVVIKKPLRSDPSFPYLSNKHPLHI